jgi:hypothetical protein
LSYWHDIDFRPYWEMSVRNLNISSTNRKVIVTREDVSCLSTCLLRFKLLIIILIFIIYLWKYYVLNYLFFPITQVSDDNRLNSYLFLSSFLLDNLTNINIETPSSYQVHSTWSSTSSSIGFTSAAIKVMAAPCHWVNDRWGPQNKKGLGPPVINSMAESCHHFYGSRCESIIYRSFKNFRPIDSALIPAHLITWAL